LRALEAIRKRLDKAYDYFFDLQSNPYGPGDEHYQQIDEENAVTNMLDAWLLIITLCEKCSDQTLLKRAVNEYEECKKSPLDSDMGYEDPYLIWQYRAEKLLDIIEDLHVQKRPTIKLESSIDLIAVIQNMERYVTSRIIFDHLPANAADLHNRIEKALECIYSDVRHKPPIAKSIKGFEGDTGLPDLSTLIEYKYIDSIAKRKSAFEQILADMSGYQSDDYKVVIFVMYETERFSRDEEWTAAIKQCNPTSTVEIILLKGLPPTTARHTQ